MTGGEKGRWRWGEWGGEAEETGAGEKGGGGDESHHEEGNG